MDGAHGDALGLSENVDHIEPNLKKIIIFRENKKKRRNLRDFFLLLFPLAYIVSCRLVFVSWVPETYQKPGLYNIDAIVGRRGRRKQTLEEMIAAREHQTPEKRKEKREREKNVSLVER